MTNKQRTRPSQTGKTPKGANAKNAKKAAEPSPVLKLAENSSSSDSDVPCGVCNSMVTEKHKNPIMCEICDKWHHLECTDLDKKAYDFLEIAATKYPGIKWYCSSCSAEPLNDERSMRQDARIDKLGSMVEAMQSKMESVLTLLESEKVEQTLEITVSEALTEQREIDEKKCNLMIFNLPESKDKEEDLSKVKEVLHYVNSEEVVDYLSTTVIIFPDLVNPVKVIRDLDPSN